MITWAKVDFPEPLGPMTAWTSPDETERVTPRRMSDPSTPARRFVISSVLTSGDLHQDVVGFHCHRIDRHGSGGRQRLGLACLEREGAAVLPALDLALLGP